ncbi:ABC transporter substrate-binding protein [Zavarzinia compransoris]|uniref:Solute-binding protein family 5 domain-containing protein n=1 Tax=Zavarzinia compransoris TaxID=1264899 RepID=A0A317DUE1_9PROT|nr:ABC transporter substrate-binding protein [Zavarzinia compransoris]PWR18261.1 hypothetical protein DKG75_20030 [Zavarzinia compransoris]TDP43683.1 peptide/nickel transport system substrate-binding protein [Zavarzinia compransoris]
MRALLFRLCAAAAITIAAALPARAETPTGTLTVGVYAFNAARGNPFQTIGTPGLYLWSAVLDALTEIGPGGAPVPALALSWQQVEPTRWRFHLRPGIAFANGETFDAAAVVHTIDILRDDRHRHTQAGALVRTVTSAAATDPLTVEITTKSPNAALPAELAGVFIVPPRAWAEIGEEAFAGAALGTGPFRFDHSEPSRIELVANPASWRKPRLERITFLELPEEAARVSALLSGAIDLAIQVSAETRDQLLAGGAGVVSWPAPLVITFGLSTEAPGSPFRDRRVRQAVNYAVDKQAIVEQILGGETTAASQPASPVAIGFDPTIEPYPYDPDKAKALLAEAGYPDGFPAVIDIAVNAIPGDAVIYGAAAQDLARIGIQVELRALPVAAWVKKFAGGDFSGPIFGLGLSSLPRSDAMNALRAITCGRAPLPVFTCIPEIEPLIAAVDAEPDPERRVALMRQVMRRTHDEATSLFLVNSVDFAGVAARVKDFAPGSRFIHWEKISAGETP